MTRLRRLFNLAPMLMEQRPAPRAGSDFGPALGPRLRRAVHGGVERLVVLPRRHWKVIGTAAGGLLFGSLKGEETIRRFVTDPGWESDFGMAVLAGLWLLWLVAFASEFFGTETWRVERGTLVVSRGIGPLRRTYRFAVREVSGLDRDGPMVDEGSLPKIHHIYWTPKLGTVRFDHRGKTRFFAETLDMDEAALVVGWLQPKLPRSAGEIASRMGR